jgi:hypothetical protein
MLYLHKDLSGHWNGIEDEPWLHHVYETSNKIEHDTYENKKASNDWVVMNIALAPVSSLRRRCEVLERAVNVTVRGG